MELVRDGKDDESFAEIPILGTVAAGRPILALENMDGFIKLHRSFVRNGEIAVVMLDDDAVTLKTFYRENNRIRLQPEHSNYSPIFCSRDVRVLGRLAHIIRSYG
jgi:repressor LexA